MAITFWASLIDEYYPCSIACKMHVKRSYDFEMHVVWSSKHLAKRKAAWVSADVNGNNSRRQYFEKLNKVFMYLESCQLRHTPRPFAPLEFYEIRFQQPNLVCTLLFPSLALEQLG
jgi:hypothetical protein